MEDVKGLLASRTIWGAIIVIVSTLAGLLGYAIAPEDQEALVLACATIGDSVGAILVVIGRVKATKRVQLGGGLQSHPLVGLALAGLVFGGALLGAACAKDPVTGADRTTGERIAVGLEYLIAASQIINAVTTDAEPDVNAALMDKIDRGIEVYCALPPASQALMINDIDPAVLAVAVRHRGGADGDVCTDDRYPL